MGTQVLEKRDLAVRAHKLTDTNNENSIADIAFSDLNMKQFVEDNPKVIIWVFGIFSFNIPDQEIVNEN